MSKNCFFCDSPIQGRSVEVWSEPVSGGAVSFHQAHVGCAALLSDDEPEEEDDDEKYLYDGTAGDGVEDE